MPDLLAVSGLERTSMPFRRRLLEVAAERGLDADALAAVMSLETGGLFQPGLYPSSGSVGLIQFTSVSAKAIGRTLTGLAALTAVAQLTEVGRYFDYVERAFGKDVESLDDHGLAVFAPAFVGDPTSPAALAYEAPGGVTVAKYLGILHGIYAEAQARPRLPVDEVHVASGGLLLPLTAAVIAAFGLRRIRRRA